MAQRTLSAPVFIKVKDLVKARSGYNVIVKVIEAEEKKITTRNGEEIVMVNCVVADETGAAKAFFKGENATQIKKGNYISIRNGVKRFIKGHISLEVDLFGRVLSENKDFEPKTEENISDEEFKFQRRNRPPPRQNNRRFDNRPKKRFNNFDRRDNRNRNPNRNFNNRPRDREFNKDRDFDRNKDRDFDRNKDRDYDKPRFNNKDRDFDRNKDRDFDRNKDRDFDRNKDRDFDKPRFNKDRDYDRNRPNFKNERPQRERKYEEKTDQRDQREQRGYKNPMVKINEIDPGQDDIRMIVRVESMQLVQGKTKKFRCVLGDETGTVNAFLPENDNIAVGKTILLSRAEAKVVNEHIEIQLPRFGNVIEARNKVDKVGDRFNLSEKSWVPAD